MDEDSSQLPESNRRDDSVRIVVEQEVGTVTGGKVVGAEFHHVEKLILDAGQAAAPPAEGDPPYKGLDFYDVADAPLYYGREKLTAELVAFVREHSFLAIIGASGSGKSSLARAGLVASLRGVNARPLEGGRMPPLGSRKWEYRELTPTAEPCEALARGLAGEGAEAEALLRALRADPLALRERAATLAGLGGRLLLLVDQFEELFTLCKNTQERTDYVAALLAACDAPDFDAKATVCTVILTVRADFYAQCLSIEGLRAVLEGHQKNIGAMSRAELQRTIELPARDGKWAFQQGLVEQILADVRDEPGKLPLLSYALLETWQRRSGRVMTLAGYQAAGGVDKAISQTAERVYAELDGKRLGDVTRSIFLSLVEPVDADRATRRRQPPDALTHGESDSPQAVALLALSAPDARLVTVDEVVQISHEALLDAWPRLAEWLKTYRTDLRLLDSIRDAAAAWQAAPAVEQDNLVAHRGSRLEDALKLRDRREYALDANARAYLAACVALQEREAAKLEAQRQRELEQAQRLAEEQRWRAEEGIKATRGLRKRLIAVAALVVIAAIALVVAVALGAESRTQRDRAESALATATVAQGQAETEAEKARTAQATAEAERAAAQLQAAIAQMGELAAESKSVVVDAPQLGLLLAAEAVSESLSLGEENRSVKAEQALLDALTMAGGTPLAAPGSQIYGLVFSEDGRWLAAQSTWDAPTRLWDLNADGTGRPRQRWIDTMGMFPDSPDTPLAGSPSPPGANDMPPTPRAESEEFPNDIPPVVLDTDIASLTLVPPGSGSVSASWRTPKDASVQLTHLDDPIGVGHRAEFSPDGRLVAVYNIGDDRVRLWDIGKGLAEPASIILEGAASQGTFSPNSCQLAAGDVLGVIRVWDVCEAYPPAEALTWAGHAITVTAVAYSPDGRWLATAAESEDVKLWDMQEGQPFTNPAMLKNNILVSQLEFSADGRWLLASANEGHLRVWRITNVAGEEASSAAEPVLQQGASRFALSRSGSWLVIVENHGASSATPGQFDVTVFKLQPESPQPDLVNTCGFPGAAGGVTISQDGRWIAVTHDNDDILLLDTTSANICTGPTLKAPRGLLAETLFSPDSRWLAARTEYQQIAYLWQLPLVVDQAEPVVLYGHDAPISAAAFSADNRWLATGGEDGEIRLWDLSSATIEAALPVTFHKGYDPCNAGCKIIVTPDSEWIATPYVRGDSEGIAFWEIGLHARAEPSFLCRNERGYWSVWEILDMAYNAEAGLLAIRHGSGDLDLFGVDILNHTCAPKMALEQNDWPWPDSTATGFSRDGRWLVLQHEENQTRQLWDMTGGVTAGTIPCSASAPPDGASLAGQVLVGGHLVAWGSDGSGATWCSDRLLEDTVESVSSANQQWGAIYRGNDSISETGIWNLDLTEPQVIRSLSGSGSSARVLAIDNSGRWFAQHNGTGFSVSRLDTGGIEMPPLVSQPEPTSDAAFSEDGVWFAAVSIDGVIRLWNTAQLGPRGPLLFHLDPDETQTGRWTGASVSFSPDSQWLIGFSTTGVKMWPLAAQSWIDQACQIAARPMTLNEMWLHRGDMSDPQLCLK